MWNHSPTSLVSGPLMLLKLIVGGGGGGGGGEQIFASCSFPPDVSKIFNMKTTKVTIAILWIMALFAPLPYVVAGHDFFFHSGKVFCTYDVESLHEGYGVYLVLVYIAIPLIIITICYTRVFIAVRQHNLVVFRQLERIRPLNRQLNFGPDNPRLSVEEVKVTNILLVVVVAFLSCWTPVLVIDLIDFINGDWKLKRP